MASPSHVTNKDSLHHKLSPTSNAYQWTQQQSTLRRNQWFKITIRPSPIAPMMHQPRFVMYISLRSSIFSAHFCVRSCALLPSRFNLSLLNTDNSFWKDRSKSFFNSTITFGAEFFSSAAHCHTKVPRRSIYLFLSVVVCAFSWYFQKIVDSSSRWCWILVWLRITLCVLHWRC